MGRTGRSFSHTFRFAVHCHPLLHLVLVVVVMVMVAALMLLALVFDHDEESVMSSKCFLPSSNCLFVVMYFLGR